MYRITRPSAALGGLAKLLVALTAEIDTHRIIDHYHVCVGTLRLLRQVPRSPATIKDNPVSNPTA